MDKKTIKITEILRGKIQYEYSNHTIWGNVEKRKEKWSKLLVNQFNRSVPVK